MKQKKELCLKFPFAIGNHWIYVIENPIISRSPNTPAHEDDDFHEDRDTQILFDSSENLQGQSIGRERDAYGLPTCSSKVAAK